MNEINIDEYNLRYCKYCGGPLLNEKCTQCGKKAFSITKLAIVALAILCVFFAYRSWVLTNQINYINQEFRDRFATYTNPITGEYVYTAIDYLNAIDAQMDIENMPY